MQIVPKNTPILIIDDDEGLLMSVRATLTSCGMPEPAVLSNTDNVISLVDGHPFRVILLDLIMPNVSGMEILKKLKEEYPNIECVIITAIDDVSTAVDAMRFGAYDYLVKPLQKEKLIVTINNALEKYHLRNRLDLYGRHRTFSDLENPDAFRSMIATDNAMADVFHQAQLCAKSDYNILISGETGVGKELLARIIHELSNRSKGPFVAVNMAAFSKTLFEDELFGHNRGAYTGATEKRKGFIDEARGGTLFLDEITELSTEFQGKILRVIQEREFYPLGSTEKKEVNLRFISATNRDISQEVEMGGFRKDLFYRLNVCHIAIPPLRKRKEDIIPLAHHFLEMHAEKNKKACPELSTAFKSFLMSHSFPGNVRELENIISTVIISGEGGVPDFKSIDISDIVPELPVPLDGGSLRLDEVEKNHIMKVMARTKGNRTQAAKLLGIGLRTLQRKLKNYENH